MPPSALPMKFLRKIPFLSTLKSRDLKRIARISKLREVPKGALIFSKAEGAGNMFIVMSGRVKIFIHSAAKKKKTFAYLKTGDFFGEMALLGGKPRSASAQAVLASRLLLVGKSDFKKLLISDPALTYYLLRSVSNRLRRANEEIESLLFRNILGRVSKTLSDLSKENGKSFRGGTILRDSYSHQELADLVGTTREPLTRALSTLKRAELIEFRHGRYFIKDKRRLAGLSLATP